MGLELSTTSGASYYSGFAQGRGGEGREGGEEDGSRKCHAVGAPGAYIAFVALSKWSVCTAARRLHHTVGRGGGRGRPTCAWLSQC